MQRNKIFAHSLLTGIALLALSQSPKANAETTWAQRGPHGAIQVVDSDRSLPGATSLKNRGSYGFPNLVTHGSHGAITIANDRQRMQPETPHNTKMAPQSNREMSMPKFHTSSRLSAEEFLQLTNALI